MYVCVLKNTICMLKARRGDKQIQRKASDPRYIHVPWLPHMVCREKGKPWQIEFSSFPHGQWIFASWALLTLKASAWRTNVAAWMFYLWMITHGLNAHCRQALDGFVASNQIKSGSAAAGVSAATWQSLIIASRAGDVKTEEKARDPTKTCRKV